MNRLALLIGLFLTCSLVSAQTPSETYVVNTDAADGGDGLTDASGYDHLQDALSSRARDFSVTPGIVMFDVFGDTTDDVPVTSWAGWANPTASSYIWVRVRPSARHTGARDGTKYLLAATNDYSAVVVNPPAYAIIEGLQVLNNSTAGDSGISVTATNVTIRDCLIYACGNGVYANGTNTKIIQCPIVSCNYGVYLNSSRTASLVNCTILNSVTAGAYCKDWATLTGLNTYIGSQSGTAWLKEGTGTFSLTKCCSSDGSASTTTVALSTDNFANIASGSEDPHLVAGSGLIGDADFSGNDASSHISVDLDGDSRPQGGYWDFGADEYESAAVLLLVASSPSPTDGATGQNRTVKLSWMDDAAAVAHDLWGGTNPAALSQLQAGSTQTWQVVPNLTPGVPYYWRVDEIDGSSNTTTGEVWVFMPTGKVGVRRS